MILKNIRYETTSIGIILQNSTKEDAWTNQPEQVGIQCKLCRRVIEQFVRHEWRHERWRQTRISTIGEFSDKN